MRLSPTLRGTNETPSTYHTFLVQIVRYDTHGVCSLFLFQFFSSGHLQYVADQYSRLYPMITMHSCAVSDDMLAFMHSTRSHSHTVMPLISPLLKLCPSYVHQKDVMFLKTPNLSYEITQSDRSHELTFSMAVITEVGEASSCTSHRLQPEPDSMVHLALLAR